MMSMACRSSFRSPPRATLWLTNSTTTRAPWWMTISSSTPSPRGAYATQTPQTPRHSLLLDVVVSLGLGLRTAGAAAWGLSAPDIYIYISLCCCVASRSTVVCYCVTNRSTVGLATVVVVFIVPWLLIPRTQCYLWAEGTQGAFGVRSC